MHQRHGSMIADRFTFSYANERAFVAILIHVWQSERHATLHGQRQKAKAKTRTANDHLPVIHPFLNQLVELVSASSATAAIFFHRVKLQLELKRARRHQ